MFLNIMTILTLEGNISDEASTFSDISTTSVTGATSENAPTSAFKHFAFSGVECTTTATGASSSSTSMPEDQQNTTNLSIGEDSVISEGMSIDLFQHIFNISQSQENNHFSLFFFEFRYQSASIQH